MPRAAASRSLLLLACILSGCAGSGGGDESSGPPPPRCTPPAGGVTIDFNANIQPIFDRTCALSACHGSGLLGANLNLSPGKSYRQLVDVQAFQRPPVRTRVVPGKPDSSYLIMKLDGITGITGTAMPPPGSAQPTPDEKDAIRQWITECAPGP
jgi:hypothetical protein